jgi:hypothetical protein
MATDGVRKVAAGTVGAVCVVIGQLLGTQMNVPTTSKTQDMLRSNNHALAAQIAAVAFQ